MKFFHVYNEDYFEGLVKNNLINEDTGFKIQHVFSLPDEMKFNKFAKKGSKLYDIIKNGSMPFYVDRITGGVTYHSYDFDKSLIKEYERLLGEWFLGVQLHESASNRRVDWAKLLKFFDGDKGPYDLSIIQKNFIREHATTPDGKQLYGFSQGTPEEYAKMTYAQTPADFDREIRQLFLSRMDATDGHIIPCDSYYLFTKLQDEMGMKTFMPEVGCQIPLMRLAVALARGVASGAKKSWGVYYETWMHTKESGYTMPVYNSDPGNEWFLTQEAHPDDFTTHGHNGGSSRLLQKRIYYYALMSGADYFSEEWGLNCSYSSMKTFELSPYGEVKKEFINDARSMKKIKAYIPFAIVLPRDCYCVEIPEPPAEFSPYVHRGEYMRCILTEDEKKYYGRIEDLLYTIYGRHGKAYGNEGHTVTNSRIGDLFDIIYEDSSNEVLSKYDTLIDATPSGKIAAKLGEKYRILKNVDTEKLLLDIEKRAREILPCYVDGLHWLISKDGSDNSYLSVFNNEGNERSLAYGDRIDHCADRTVEIKFKSECMPVVIKSSCGVKLEKKDGKTYRLAVPATEFVILKY